MKKSTVVVHVACTGHVTHEKSAVAVHVACNRVLVMYPMKKSTVVVDSIACSFPLGYYFRTAPCKHFPERNQCGS